MTKKELRKFIKKNLKKSARENQDIRNGVFRHSTTVHIVK